MLHIFSSCLFHFSSPQPVCSTPAVVGIAVEGKKMPLCIPGSRFGDNGLQRLSTALQNFWPISSTLPASPTNSIPSPPMHVTEVILGFCYQQSERSQRGHNKPLVGINTTIHPSSAALSLNRVVGLGGGGWCLSQLPSAERWTSC